MRLLFILLFSFFFGVFPVKAQETIKIGSINSFTNGAFHALPYRKGLDLAIEQINNAGGIQGQVIDVTHVDDKGQAGEGVRIAEELILRDDVDILTGVYQSRIALSVSQIAEKYKIPLMAMGGTIKLLWDEGHPFVFRMFPSHFTQTAILADIAATYPQTRWATIAPNNEYGDSMVTSFKRSLEAKRKDIVWVTEQWPHKNKINSAAEVQAIKKSNPDALFVPLFGADLLEFIREGNKRNLFQGRLVFATHVGYPEFLDHMKDEAPEGWITNGYPWSDIERSTHQKFVQAYQEKYNERPAYTSLMGYMMVQTLVDACQDQPCQTPGEIKQALKNKNFQSPIGSVHFRTIDQQITAGLWVGKIAVQNGQGRMVDFVFKDGKLPQYHIPDQEIISLREDN